MDNQAALVGLIHLLQFINKQKIHTMTNPKFAQETKATHIHQETGSVFDQLRQQEISFQAKKLRRHVYWWLSKQGDASQTVLFDTETQLLWSAVPQEELEVEHYAILGRDFRTNVSDERQWNSEVRMYSDSFKIIPLGWHVANTERVLAVCRKATFTASWGLTSNSGASYRHYRNDSSCSSYSSSMLQLNAHGVDTKDKDFQVLLEKDGAEDLELSTDLKDAASRKITYKPNPKLELDWVLPICETLTKLVVKDNPFRQDEDARLLSTANWRTNQKDLLISTDKKGHPVILSQFTINPRVLMVNESWQAAKPESIVAWLLNNGWQLAAHSSSDVIMPRENITLLKDMDYRPVRLPRLEQSQFTDISKGIWEFWGEDESLLESQHIVARNPLKDMRSDNVAIDFGTSSTVVAVSENGRPQLLRIGVKDFYEPVKASHYENPTVLEFIDISKLLSAWQKKACRPSMDWAWLCASHEAQTNFRNSQNDIGRVSSVLPKMKQWALRQLNDYKVKLIDQENKFAYELPQLSLREYRKNQIPAVSTEDPLDPIELYAWFLGMTINWRGRGIYTRYYMTFPVAYPKDVKDKILSSFQRGLIRSMPQSLVEQSEFHNKFSLKELGSEPAAYAASALEELGIMPSATGVAYGVFDFGGGTTDFDYGIYRTATAEEEDENGVERILEHIKNEGDQFLGGENLLENIAFQTFNANLDICRAKKIAFTKPLDANPMPGTELLIDKTQAAQTNTIIMMSKLRAFWESGSFTPSSSKGIESLQFIDRDGQVQVCEITIPIDELDRFLYQRIKKGFEAFFIGLQNAFSVNMPDSVNILLAGNSSRSKWVCDFFGSDGQSDDFKAMVQAYFPSVIPKFIIHQPLPINEEEPFKPTAKTGVALGLLKLCTGELRLSKRHAGNESNEAAFNHYVGRIRQGNLLVALSRGTHYRIWHELGPINLEGSVYLQHTQSVKANTGSMTKEDADLMQKRIDFVGDLSGCRAFVRAIDPNRIEICSATSIDAAACSEYENLQEVLLS